MTMALNLADSPLTLGDLQQYAEVLEQRFKRAERVIEHMVEMLDLFPDKMEEHVTGLLDQRESDRDLAQSVKGEYEDLIQDPNLGPLFKDRPMRRDMLFQGWTHNPHMSLREVAEKLKAEIFSELVDEGIPPAEAEQVAADAAEGVAGKIAGGLDPQDHGKQAARDAEGVMKHGGKIAKGLLSRLDAKKGGLLTAAAGGPGKRSVEHGGMPKTRTSRAGTSSDFRRPGDKDWNKA